MKIRPGHVAVRLGACVFVLFVATFSGFGATPSNDPFAAASEIFALPASVPANNTAATEEFKEPLVFNMMRTIWWKWTPVASGWVTVSSDVGASSMDTILAVYTGATLDTLQELAMNDDGTGLGLGSQVAIPVTSGVPYYIQVGGYEGAEGSFTVAITSIPAPGGSDAFSGADLISGAPPLAIDGANVGATEESGEELFEDAVRTVWWQWTPGTSGWVRVTTTGIDTVLAVFTGPSLALLEVVDYNDDGEFLSDFGSSVQIFVNAGTTYFIQVGGADEEGLFTLTINDSPAPPELVSLTFTPSMPDISASGVAVMVDVGIRHPAGFSYGQVDFYSPNGDFVGSAFPDSSTLITGSATDGIFRGSFFIAQLWPPGDYEIGGFHLVGDDETEAFYGFTVPIPAGIVPQVTVLNTGPVDADPPEIVDLIISPPSIDVTSAGVQIMITLHLRDLLSGIGEFFPLTLRDPSLELIDRVSISSQNRVAGDSFDSTYEVFFDVPAGAPPGTYSLALTMGDGFINRVTYGLAPGEDPFPAGVSHTLTVVNTGSTDQSPPVLTGLTFSPNPVNAAGPDLFTIAPEITDNLSGVVEIDFDGNLGGLRPQSGGPLIPMAGSWNLVSGTANNGIWEESLPLNDALPAGVYTLMGLRIVDALGNEVTYGPVECGMTPFPAAVNPDVTIVNNPGPTPYEIWLVNFPSIVGSDRHPLANADTDPWNNLLELAFGLNPTIPSYPGGADPNAGNAPVVEILHGNKIRITYTTEPANLGSGADRIIVLPKKSSDLVNWSTAPRIIVGPNQTQSEIDLVPGTSGFLLIEVEDPNVFVP